MSKPKYTDEFEIPLRCWLRGEGPDESYLYRTKDKKQCCVGIYLRHCGMKVKDLKGQPGAEDVACNGDNPLPSKASWLVDGGSLNTIEASSLYSINDAVDMSETERKKQVKAQFAEVGIKVKFVP